MINRRGASAAAVMQSATSGGGLPPADSGLGPRAPQLVPVGREVAFHSWSGPPAPTPQPLLLVLAGQVLRNWGLFASRLQASCL